MVRIRNEKTKAYDREYSRLWRKRNPEKKLKQWLLYKKRNREAARRNDNRLTAKLTDRYAKNKLLKRGITSPTQQQIESCRQRIQLKRAARTFKMLHAAQVLSNLSPT